MILIATFFPATQCTPSFTKPIQVKEGKIRLLIFFR